MEVNQQARCRELAMSSSFYSAVYSEIEEVGWEHLVRVGGDLNFLIFRVLDTKGRVHVLEIELDKAYPKVPPMVSADVPYIFNLEWTMNSRLKNLVQQFEENLGVLLPIQHLEKLQGFWYTLDEIDRSLQIVDSKQASRAIGSTICYSGNDCFMILSISINDPRSLPECRFMGSGIVVNSLRKTWKRNVDKWYALESRILNFALVKVRDNAFLENLECLLNTQLPRLADEEKNNHLDECGICYAQYLPIGDEHTSNSGIATDYICENNSCSKAFHSMCLVDWMRSITTTRQSFNVLFGNCPYCSEPNAVKINSTKN
ncbi:Zinc ion binding, putative isoform 2 [Hibiscus syriacus]|uniref:Zinc ion binding, putative isoform 2 n=1 Tax=Hibiscus syriacus TaxID=106335 RepID=A0A6A3BK08_HIBSY|nr:Zinc ion binding, putative isoform 2 [Hibiscus syriacus]